MVPNSNRSAQRVREWVPRSGMPLESFSWPSAASLPQDTHWLMFFSQNWSNQEVWNVPKQFFCEVGMCANSIRVQKHTTGLIKSLWGRGSTIQKLCHFESNGSQNPQGFFSKFFEKWKVHIRIMFPCDFGDCSCSSHKTPWGASENVCDLLLD